MRLRLKKLSWKPKHLQIDYRNKKGEVFKFSAFLHLF